MELLDGLYRHGGALVTWDAHGVSLTRGGDDVARLAWHQIADVRQVGVEAGYLQLVLHGRQPVPDYRNDRFVFAVNSEHDANRLMTSIRWYAAAARPARRSRWRLPLRRAGAPSVPSQHCPS